MVINSTNINKANRNLSSWQNSLNTKDTMTYDIGQILTWDRHKKEAVLMESQPSSLDNWISNSNTYIHRFVSTLKKTHTIRYYEKNEWHFLTIQY